MYCTKDCAKASPSPDPVFAHTPKAPASSQRHRLAAQNRHSQNEDLVLYSFYVRAPPPSGPQHNIVFIRGKAPGQPVATPALPAGFSSCLYGSSVECDHQHHRAQPTLARITTVLRLPRQRCLHLPRPLTAAPRPHLPTRDRRPRGHMGRLVGSSRLATVPHRRGYAPGGQILYECGRTHSTRSESPRDCHEFYGRAPLCLPT